jgi:predicted nucleotidyltransferase
LYGSHAWGTPNEDSDVDLMVIVRDSDETSVRRSQRAHHCLRGLRMSKDVVVPTRAQVDRYKHLRASLFHQVLTQGRKLYG